MSSLGLEIGDRKVYLLEGLIETDRSSSNVSEI
jgi:hypothetical protein